jgi:hypothetical protein
MNAAMPSLQQDMRTPQFHRTHRPLSATQLRVQKQYEAEGRAPYSPPPTAVDHSTDKEFCRLVGLTPAGGVRSNPTPTELRRPASPAHDRAIAQANGGVYVSRAVEKAVLEQQKKRRIDAERRQANACDAANNNALARSRMPLGVGTMLSRQLLATPDVIRRNVEPEQRSGTGSGLRGDAHTREIGAAASELVLDPQTTQDASRRREFATINSLASSLCGPGSLLARKLAGMQEQQQ